MLIKNPKEIIDSINGSMNRESLQGKESHNQLISDFDYLIVQKYDTPVENSNDDFLLVFWSKTLDIDGMHPKLIFDDPRFKIIRIWRMSEESEFKDIASRNIGTYTETSLLKKYDIPSVSLEEFTKTELVDKNLVKPLDQYKNLFTRVLVDLLGSEYHNMEDRVNDDCINSGIKFYCVRDDVDSYEKYGNIEYAITHEGVLCGKLTRTGRWLDCYYFHLINHPEFPDLAQNFKHELFGYYDPIPEEPDDFVKVDSETNMLNVFTLDTYYAKEYS